MTPEEMRGHQVAEVRTAYGDAHDELAATQCVPVFGAETTPTPLGSTWADPAVRRAVRETIEQQPVGAWDDPDSDEDGAL